jgi:hypothetical protein
MLSLASIYFSEQTNTNVGQHRNPLMEYGQTQVGIYAALDYGLVLKVHIVEIPMIKDCLKVSKNSLIDQNSMDWSDSITFLEQC